MNEALFLLVWTALFVAVVHLSWKKITGHFKVYLMVAYNFVYLTGVFFLFPRVRAMVDYLKELF